MWGEGKGWQMKKKAWRSWKVDQSHTADSGRTRTQIPLQAAALKIWKEMVEPHRGQYRAFFFTSPNWAWALQSHTQPFYRVKSLLHRLLYSRLLFPRAAAVVTSAAKVFFFFKEIKLEWKHGNSHATEYQCSMPCNAPSVKTQELLVVQTSETVTYLTALHYFFEENPSLGSKYYWFYLLLALNFPAKRLLSNLLQKHN